VFGDDGFDILGRSGVKHKTRKAGGGLVTPAPEDPAVVAIIVRGNYVGVTKFISNNPIRGELV